MTKLAGMYVVTYSLTIAAQSPDHAHLVAEQRMVNAVLNRVDPETGECDSPAFPPAHIEPERRGGVDA